VGVAPAQLQGKRGHQSATFLSPQNALQMQSNAFAAGVVPRGPARTHQCDTSKEKSLVSLSEKGAGGLFWRVARLSWTGGKKQGGPEDQPGLDQSRLRRAARSGARQKSARGEGLQCGKQKDWGGAWRKAASEVGILLLPNQKHGTLQLTRIRVAQNLWAGRHKPASDH